MGTEDIKVTAMNMYKYKEMLNAEFLTRAQKTSHLQRQAGMILAMHGLTRSAQTAGRVLGFSTRTRINDIFKKQQATDQRKRMDTTVETAYNVN